MIPPDDVADWIDSNDWNQMDYREIGRGVNADMVLGIDVGDLRLHEGQTLYQGRVTLTITVYDMQDDGKVAFRRTMPDFTFPQNGPRHATEMTEARFRAVYRSPGETSGQVLLPVHVRGRFRQRRDGLGGLVRSVCWKRRFETRARWTLDWASTRHPPFNVAPLARRMLTCTDALTSYFPHVEGKPL